ncbi:MAG TPA: sugar phosphate nucleotidyltransferase, partial [bacterium]|nr:sugar phosphate nucleotidyltransferase [bacterium]
QPSGRFGAMAMDSSGMVQSFQEKPKGDGAWVNAGFFIFENSVLQLLKDDQTVLEREPLETLARSQSLVAFKHDRFWQPMDTLRDKNMLDELIREKRAPWVIW